MKMSDVVSRLCAVTVLVVVAACASTEPVPDDTEAEDGESETDEETGSDGDADTDGDGDTDADTGTDTEADTDDDTSTESESASDVVLCIYDCVPATWGCDERFGYLHDEMTCPNPEEICCDNGKFMDIWECLICSAPYPAGVRPHNLRD